MITQYRYDFGKYYLELHALRAPVWEYLPEITAEEYAWRVACAIRVFEIEHKIQLYSLGRSGRHICIKDTPTNRRRYASVQRKAIAAATELWASMKA